jgi:hypothetical protein
MTWDVNKAVKHLKNHARLHSTGKCASYVRQAIEAGGSIHLVRQESAKNYGTSLRIAGFTEYTSIPPGGYKAGDVAVIQSPDSKHLHGHMQMYSGTNWISDFVQNSFWAGSSYRSKTPSFKIYRME